MATPVLGPILFGSNLTFAEKNLASLLTQNLTNPALTTTASQILVNNADRMELIIFNTGANDAMILMDPSVSTTNGFRLFANGGFIIFKLIDDYTLMTLPFFALSVAATTTLTVVELVRIVSQPLGQI
jgi:hypothetical protein